MTLPEQLKQIPKSSRPALVLIFVAVVLLSFLSGLVPMWVKAERGQKGVAELERKVALIELENTLGAAAIEARGGRYEPARKEASEFFTDLSFQLDQGQDSALPTKERQPASVLLKGRDELITLLARGDPAGADRLAELYVAYRGIMSPRREYPGAEALNASPESDAPVGGSP